MKIFGLYISKYKQPKTVYKDLNDFSVRDYRYMITVINQDMKKYHTSSDCFKYRFNLLKRLYFNINKLCEEINHSFYSSKNQYHD